MRFTSVQLTGLNLKCSTEGLPDVVDVVGRAGLEAVEVMLLVTAKRAADSAAFLPTEEKNWLKSSATSEGSLL